LPVERNRVIFVIFEGDGKAALEHAYYNIGERITAVDAKRSVKRETLANVNAVGI